MFKPSLSITGCSTDGAVATRATTPNLLPLPTLSPAEAVLPIAVIDAEYTGTAECTKPPVTPKLASNTITPKIQRLLII